MACVKFLLNAGVAADEIGVITFYEEQSYRIRERLGPRIGVQVANVDGFQGREKHFIIISAVRANDSGDAGFTGNPNRLNVSLTRAKHGLILLCNVSVRELPVDNAAVYFHDVARNLVYRFSLDRHFLSPLHHLLFACSDPARGRRVGRARGRLHPARPRHPRPGRSAQAP